MTYKVTAPYLVAGISDQDSPGVAKYKTIQNLYKLAGPRIEQAGEAISNDPEAPHWLIVTYNRRFAEFGYEIYREVPEVPQKPTGRSTKADIQAYLNDQEITYPEEATKAQLLGLIP